MGSCIGTCGPRQDQNLKIVIDPIAPPSPSRSCSSLSSFSCNTSSSSSLSSTSSSASSILTAKDRTFSNEFLLTCIKDNPHIIRIKERGEAMSDVVAPTTTSQKRSRSGSPNLTRQKSSRKDPDRSYYAPTRTSLRSPSPSRRFSGGANKVDSSSTKSLSLATNYKENLRPPTPHISGHRSCLRRREAVSVNHNISGSRLDEATSSVMEEIHNPHISLDCFIFL